MRKEEGHYTIKIVDRLPKRGNANWLYSLKKDSLSVFYFWTLSNNYEKVDLSDSIGAEPTSIQAGTNITITGTGTSTDPYIINAVPETAQETLITPIAGLSAINTQEALEEIKLIFDSVSNAEENVQPDWDQINITQDDFIQNKPTNTSEFTNDGENGSNPFISQLDTYTIDINGNNLRLLNNGNPVNIIDLSLYLDDTNLARLVSGVLNISTGIVTFTRDDNTTFDIDFSDLSNRAVPTGLESVSEAGNTGLRVIGRNENNFGNIGQDSIDLSQSTIPIANGATGNNSLSYGLNTMSSGNNSIGGGDRSNASGISSVSLGLLNTSTGNYSVTLGRQNNVTSESSSGIGYLNSILTTNAHAIGFNNTIENTAPFGVSLGRLNRVKGSSSTALGFNLTSESLGETNVGLYNTTYTPTSRTDWAETDRVFNVGNGSFPTNLSDAFTIYKNGAVQLHPVTESSIINASTGMLIIDSADSNKLKFYDGTSWRTVSFT